MLKISYNISETSVVPFSDIEKIFDQTKMEDTPLVRKIIEKIEQGEFIDINRFRDRFGYTLSTDCLSTGCKAAIILALGYSEPLDLTECGYNARDYIIHLCHNGDVVLNSTFLFGWDDEDESCDVEFNGYEFTLISRLNFYIDEEWDDEVESGIEPDLSIPGIKKISTK